MGFAHVNHLGIAAATCSPRFVRLFAVCPVRQVQVLVLGGPPVATLRVPKPKGESLNGFRVPVLPGSNNMRGFHVCRMCFQSSHT